MTYLKFLWSLIRHKWFVFIECCKLGMPWLGIIHDWSKFRPSEFVPYARYFYGKRTMADIPGEIMEIFAGERDFVEQAFDIAWLHHQKRNKHHWQYWLLVNDSDEPQIRPLPMPEHYRREMVADWRGAGRAYGNPDTQEWYLKNREKIILHPETRTLVELDLGMNK